jgi:hypothetical protein
MNLHVKKYPLLLWIFKINLEFGRQISEKFEVPNLIKFRPVGISCYIHRDGRTDRRMRPKRCCYFIKYKCFRHFVSIIDFWARSSSEVGVSLKIRVFWDVALYGLASSLRRSDRSQLLDLSGQAVEEWTLFELKAMWGVCCTNVFVNSRPDW